MKVQPDPMCRIDLELKAELVLRCAECVPAGQVVTYGNIAQIVGTGPRQVGRIMAVYGSSVPWWRITNAKGELPVHLAERAAGRWREEGTPYDDGRDTKRGTNHGPALNPPRVRIGSARADLIRLRAEWEKAVQSILPET